MTVRTTVFFAIPLSQDDVRVTSASSYLTASVRNRPNLTIMDRSRVDRITFEGVKVSGVKVSRGGVREEIFAKQVVVSAGAINSPALLLRSGIGPAADLIKLGVPVVADRTGVGSNYQNHPLLNFALTLKPGERLSELQRNYAMTGLRFSSGVDGCPKGDLMLYQIGRVSNETFGAEMAMMAVGLYSPLSRGSVFLTSADPDVAPHVDQRLLSEPRDVERMIIAARFAESLILEKGVKSRFNEVYLLPRVLPLRLINGTGLVGAIKARMASMVFRAPKMIRMAALDMMVRPARRISDGTRDVLLNDEEILAAAGTMAHASCTCRMGPLNDPTAVTDPECRVYGVEGLRVVDASVMPKVPSANTNIPTIMIAERASDMMRKRHG